MSKKREGGWSGIGMATVGIDPTNFEILNDHPTKIPPGELLGGVVKNCLGFGVARRQVDMRLVYRPPFPVENMPILGEFFGRFAPMT